MKTTTLAVLVSSALSVFRKKGTHSLFSADEFRMTLSKKCSYEFFLMYIVLFLVGGMVISSTEDIPLMTAFV